MRKKELKIKGTIKKLTHVCFLFDDLGNQKQARFHLGCIGL